MRNFQRDPKTTNHPNRVRNRPTSCPKRSPRSETTTPPWPRGATNVPTSNPIARQGAPQSQTQRRQRTPHNPCTAAADEISDPHLAKGDSDPFLPWVPEQGARTGRSEERRVGKECRAGGRSAERAEKSVQHGCGGAV